MHATPTEPERSKKRSTREPLTRDEVIDAALEIIDDGGLNSLTMRALGARLNAYPASLYWHTGNRGQLLSLVCQRVVEGIDLPATDLPWQDWVVRMARSTRHSLGLHPNIANYLVSHLQLSVSLTYVERTLTVLKGAGFQGETLLNVYNTITSAVFGWVSGEHAIDPEEADAEWQKGFEAHLRSSGDEYPTLGELMPLVADRAFMVRWSSAKVLPMQGSFEFMLRTLVTGLEAARRD